MRSFSAWLWPLLIPVAAALVADVVFNGGQYAIFAIDWVGSAGNKLSTILIDYVEMLKK